MTVDGPTCISKTSSKRQYRVPNREWIARGVAFSNTIDHMHDYCL